MREKDREAIRKAAQVPLLWGRGEHSLGYSISQHILALIDEQNPDGDFTVLSREEIEKLISERGYAPHSMRFCPKPKMGRLLWRWLKEMWR